MENIYKLTGKVEELNDQAEELQEQIDELEGKLAEMYEDNGGEVTDLTEAVTITKAELETKKAALAGIAQGIVTDIIEHSDDYAEWALNKENARKVAEAELKALKEQAAAAVKRAEARVRRFASREEWAKEQFAAALNIAGTEKIGGSKTDLRHSIYFKNSESIEADTEVLASPFNEMLDCIELPDYLKVKVEVVKTAFKGVADADLPEGAERIRKQTIQIR